MACKTFWLNWSEIRWCICIRIAVTSYARTIKTRTELRENCEHWYVVIRETQWWLTPRFTMNGLRFTHKQTRRELILFLSLRHRGVRVPNVQPKGELRNDLGKLLTENGGHLDHRNGEQPTTNIRIFRLVEYFHYFYSSAQVGSKQSQIPSNGEVYGTAKKAA